MNGVSCHGPAEKLSGRQMGQPSQFCTGICEEIIQLEGSRRSEDLSAEAEGSPLLEAVPREWLVKTAGCKKT
jgi:hypothetical protein